MQPPDLSPKLRAVWAAAKTYVWFLLPALGLAAYSTQQILAFTGGQPSVPLDDSYIHFQFARSFAALEPFVYVAGKPAVPGASSLLWPALLAPFVRLGLNDLNLIWVAWGLGWLSFALLGYETWQLARGLVSPVCAALTAASVYALGAFTWFSASGMEVLPLAWVLLRTARRLSEWWELDSPARRNDWIELLILSIVATTLRPEGALAALASGVTLAIRPRGLARYTASIFAVAPLLPPLANALATGHATPTTASVKWLLLNPYYDAHTISVLTLRNVGLFFGTLLNGEAWSAVFIPRGGAIVAWCALPALLTLGVRTHRIPRAAIVTLFALGILIPASFESFLVNRLRYLWPFAAPWLIAVGALTELVDRIGWQKEDSRARLRRFLGPALMAGFVLALAMRLPDTIDDLTISADAIYRQQVALGRWARETLPPRSTLGVNDAGAIAYVSGRKTFDVVGLTTLGEAAYWVMGPGSRFEHYERLERAKLPTHFIVYPEWFALDPLLGPLLTEREVPGATILGGPRMAAHLADYRLLGSGALPSELPAQPLIDEVDVADLESERAHDYVLHATNQTQNRLVTLPDRADGARVERWREDFQIQLVGGGTLVLRLGADSPLTLDLTAFKGAGTAVWQTHVELAGLAWQEIPLQIPLGIGSERVTLTLRAEGQRFSALHYWSFAHPPHR
jgi:hypothetical protein